MAPAMSQNSASTSRPLRSSRTKVRSYYEQSDSEDDVNEGNGSDVESPLGVTSASLRPRRSNYMPTSYREDSTDDGFDVEEENPYPPSRRVITTQPASSEPPGNGTTPSRRQREPAAQLKRPTKRATRSSNKRSLGLGRPLRQNKHQKIEDVDPTFVSSGVIPPWQSLPYYTLLEIMFYASHPLVDKEAGIKLKSVQWLLDMSLLCRAFHEPALSALYYCPPLIPAVRCQGLLNLLCREQGSLSTNYSNKIKVLDVDVEGVLLHRSNGFLLQNLVERTPQLRELHLYHRNDYIVGLPPWQTPQSRWSYPESLFTALNSSAVRLQSWDWNGRFMDMSRLLPFMVAVHQQRAFQSLQELRLFHLGGAIYDLFYSMSQVEEMTIVTALEQLPELGRLELRECAFFNGQLLERLPSNLTSLTIANCDGVETVDLEIFLSSRGEHLRELRLNHNRFLSLSFLRGLGQWCGRLEKLYMDLSMHDWSSYHDVEPRFDTLITAEETPTWPSTLREIECVQLRKWDAQAAEVFFTSLIESASMLPNLRRLVISAILKVGWRDRATFREKWISRLETVFLRRNDPPDQSLNTLSPTYEQTDARIIPAEDHNMNSDTKANSAKYSPSKRKSQRIARRDSTVEDSIAEDSTASDHPSIPIQGMCDVVRIRIDNQRPAEMQFNESDFLDDELSGDEDWSGQDLYIPDGYAW